MSQEAVEVPLSLAPVAISKYTGQPSPNYRALWRMIVDGELSGSRKNGRWFVNPATATQELGLAAKPSSAA